MNDVTEFTDEWGSFIRAERVPRFSSNDPELIEFLSQQGEDGAVAFVQLNYQQAAALRDVLTDLIG
jgi:murein tripeptide amidase MpaA